MDCRNFRFKSNPSLHLLSGLLLMFEFRMYPTSFCVFLNVFSRFIAKSENIIKQSFLSFYVSALFVNNSTKKMIRWKSRIYLSFFFFKSYFDGLLKTF